MKCRRKIDMKKQLVLVIARDLKHFLANIPERFNGDESFTVYNSGTVLTAHKRFKYVTTLNSLRGIHGAQVEYWGPKPDWALDRRAEIEIELATLP